MHDCVLTPSYGAQEGTLWSALTGVGDVLSPHMAAALEASFAAPKAQAAKASSPHDAVNMLKVIGLTRANNISIMLTRFTDWGGDATRIRAAVLAWALLSAERLGLLVQVFSHAQINSNLEVAILPLPRAQMLTNKFMHADGADSGGGQEAGHLAGSARQCLGGTGAAGALPGHHGRGAQDGRQNRRAAVLRSAARPAGGCAPGAVVPARSMRTGAAMRLTPECDMQNHRTKQQVMGAC